MENSLYYRCRTVCLCPSLAVRACLAVARGYARRQNTVLRPGHLLVAVLRNRVRPASQVARRMCGLSTGSLVPVITADLSDPCCVRPVGGTCEHARGVMTNVRQEAAREGARQYTMKHMILGLLVTPPALAVAWLASIGLTYDLYHREAERWGVR